MSTIIHIQNQIFTFRGTQVMVDRDLAEMYQVETKVLNQAVKRNIERFPELFRFQLSEEENDELLANYDQFQNLKSQSVTSDKNSLRSQSVTSSKHGGRRYLPYVFTEQGIAMLSAVLRSDIAIQVSIQIMNAFVETRRFLNTNAGVFQRLDNIEEKQLINDQNFKQLFNALEEKSQTPKQGVFYDGQVFDAYVFVADIIKTAKKDIVLIDNYIDETTLQLFTKRNKNVTCTIYTQKISKVLQQDVEKHNSQYPEIKLQTFKKAHDRFLIIDNTAVYHIGASLKDLGKKWFAFSKMELSAIEIIDKLSLQETKGQKTN
ncbi:MAG: ORF6N domain-containing protein [Polaribacter sp.]|uniref:ORF6N domain-containing protein n=1 Tax=Polaribacter sp. TaxID=1920175 RepID=UPI002F360D1B